MPQDETPLVDEDLINAARAAFHGDFGAVLQISPHDSAPFYIDGRGEEIVVSELPPKEPSTIWLSGKTTLMSVLQRTRALENAYLSGRLQIAGDMSVMARLVMKGR